MAGRGTLLLVVGLLGVWSQGSFAQERLLDPPVPLSASSPGPDIRPVKADLPAEPSTQSVSDKPAVRFGAIRTAGGDVGVSSPKEFEKPVERIRPVDDEFLNRRSVKGNERRTTSLSDFDPPARKETGRKSNRFGDLFGGDGLFFQGDDCFQSMISPVTNPHLFEDPRSLTEIRPMFYYQKVPSGQPEWQGGNIWYFGTQARFAINERWSVTLNKLGALSVDPGAADNEFGFGEVHIGPKWTFLRNTDTETVAATGLLFQIPVGSQSVYQDTGTLSMVPYLTLGQQLADTQAGAVNGMVATGYSFSVNRDRSDFYYLSGNINFDWMNRHRFYPLIEMNYFLYTTNGQGRPGVGFEARDVANLGGQARGSNLLTTAFGARYKINERAQIGTAFEIPFLGNRDLFRYRLTLDFIIRF